MDLVIAQTWVVLIYKLASLLAGVSLSYMGYRLFISGIWGDAGSAEGNFTDFKIIIRKAAPGTFFAVLGAMVLIAAIFKGLSMQSNPLLPPSMGKLNEKPTLSD